MSQLRCGLVGLPNVGKSTLFRALSGNPVPCANYPFSTIKPHLAVVPIPDPRLEKLATLANSAKCIPAHLAIVDIAGLIEGASSGAGLGNDFLEQIRQVDLLLHVVRCFGNGDIHHVYGIVDPLRDIAIIENELIMADWQMLERLQKKQKRNDLKAPLRHLERGLPMRTYDPPLEMPFLSAKQVIFIANVEEEGEAAIVEDYAKKLSAKSISLSALFERKVAEGVEDKSQQSTLTKLIRVCSEQLGLITFFTSGIKETRAWQVVAGSTAKQGAAKIHTDIGNNLIRAEVVSYSELMRAGGRQQAKAIGRVRSEGRDYPIADGDVILFLHN